MSKWYTLATVFMLSLIASPAFAQDGAAPAVNYPSFAAIGAGPVSYTHLTLPTILLV